MTTYEKYCYFLMAQCLEKGELLPMRQYSFVNVQFHSIVTEISQEVKKPVPRTVLSMMDILPSIIETITVTWPSFPLEQIAITYEGELIQNPFATCLKTSSSVAEIVLDINDNERVLEKIRFLDGASVHFHKPELQILLDDNPEVITLEFLPLHNVKAIKGMAMKHLSADVRKQTNIKSLQVFFKDRQLKDSENLLSLQCGKTPVIVKVK